MVLNKLIFNSFYFGHVWWFKELILTVCTLGGCGGLELIFNSFYFGRMWWS